MRGGRKIHQAASAPITSWSEAVAYHREHFGHANGDTLGEVAGVVRDIQCVHPKIFLVRER